jgi:PTK7 protein tyrosine kinase 7
MSKHSNGSANSGTDLRLLFPRQNLQSLGMLGRGEFGDVFVAKALGIRGSSDVSTATGEPNATLVYVKSLLTKDDHLHYAFKLEVEMYAKLNHANIAPLLALCREVEPHFMIVEYPEWGDLKQYLLASRKEKHRSSGGKGGVGAGPEGGERKQKPRAPPLTSAQKLTLIQQVNLNCR